MGALTAGKLELVTVEVQAQLEALLLKG